MIKDLNKHLLAWALFIGYETGGIYLATGNAGHWPYYALFYPLNIALFYINALLVLPRAARYWLLPAELLVYLAIKMALDYFGSVYWFTGVAFDTGWGYVVYNGWRGLYFIGFSTFYWLYHRNLVAQKHRLGLLVERARLEKTVAELDSAYLRQQINPHFLFNMLNFIAYSFSAASVPAADCVTKLAGILRYSFQQGPGEKASLAAELDQVRQLIALNRLRFRHPLYIQLEVTGVSGGEQIIPLVLLSFTENLFKYGELAQAEHPARVTVTLADGRLLFRTHNRKKRRGPLPGRAGVGLENTRKRLDYAYGDHHRLEVSDGAEDFELELEVYL